MCKLPANENAIWTQLVIAVNMPGVIRPSADIRAAMQTVTLSVPDANWVSLLQNEPYILPGSAQVVLGPQCVPHRSVATDTT